MGMGVGAQSVSVGPVIVTGLKDEVGVRRPAMLNLVVGRPAGSHRRVPHPEDCFAPGLSSEEQLTKKSVRGRAAGAQLVVQVLMRIATVVVGREAVHRELHLSDIVESFGHTGAPGGMKHSGTGEGTDGQKDDDRDEQGCEPPPSPDDPKLIFHHYHDGTIPCERKGILEESVPCGRPDQDHCLMARKSADSRALLGLASP